MKFKYKPLRRYSVVFFHKRISKIKTSSHHHTNSAYRFLTLVFEFVLQRTKSATKWWWHARARLWLSKYKRNFKWHERTQKCIHFRRKWISHCTRCMSLCRVRAWEWHLGMRSNTMTLERGEPFRSMHSEYARGKKIWLKWTKLWATRVRRTFSFNKGVFCLINKKPFAWHIRHPVANIKHEKKETRKYDGEKHDRLHYMFIAKRAFLFQRKKYIYFFFHSKWKRYELKPESESVHGGAPPLFECGGKIAAFVKY